MLTIERFNELTADLPNDHIIQMSNHNKEYTETHPECTNGGGMYFDAYGFEYVINWNVPQDFTLGNYRDLLAQTKPDTSEEIVSVDNADGNTIHFEHVFLHENRIILIS